MKERAEPTEQDCASRARAGSISSRIRIGSPDAERLAGRVAERLIQLVCSLGSPEQQDLGFMGHAGAKHQVTKIAVGIGGFAWKVASAKHLISIRIDHFDFEDRMLLGQKIQDERLRGGAWPGR